MASISKGKSSFWYGYLVAGERSSPVLRDDSLETGSRKTVYMYNLKRGEIIEEKLRELKSNESGWISELDSGYKKARRRLKERGGRERISVTDAVIVPLQRDAGHNDDDENGSTDSDMWLESEQA